MSGLLSGVLPAIYSAGDRAKRYVTGLLADPIGSIQQTAGRAMDDLRDVQALQSQAFANPQRPLQITNPQAFGLLADKYQNAVTNFAPVGMFIGQGAKTWDQIAAKKAHDMAAKGADPRAIWKETGTFKGPDGMWRQEIPDDAAHFGDKRGSIDYAIAQNINDPLAPSKVGEILRHDDLYQAYPDTQNIGTSFNLHSGGSYAPYSSINPETIAIGTRNKSTAIHELQHAIQQREGWAGGGSPESMSFVLAEASAAKKAEAKRLMELAMRNDPLNPSEVVKPGARAKALAAENQAREYEGLLSRMREFGAGFETDAYKRLAGEAEARATQARMNMNAAQRREVFPLDSYDVPVNQLIVRYGDGKGLLGK